MLEGNACFFNFCWSPRQHLGPCTTNKGSRSMFLPWLHIAATKSFYYAHSLWRLNSFLTIMCVQPCFTISKLIQEAYFSWYMPQASCYYGKSYYWSAMLLVLCISYTSTLTCITDREHIFSHPAELQVKLLHVFCLGYLLSNHAKYAIDLNILYV